MRLSLAAAAALLVGLPGCYYGGACVEQTSEDPRADFCSEQLEFLFDEVDPGADCAGEYHLVDHCKDLGFTEECGGVYRRPGGC